MERTLLWCVQGWLLTLCFINMESLPAAASSSCTGSHMRAGGWGRYVEGDLSRQKTHRVLTRSKVCSLDAGNGFSQLSHWKRRWPAVNLTRPKKQWRHVHCDGLWPGGWDFLLLHSSSPWLLGPPPGFLCSTAWWSCPTETWCKYLIWTCKHTWSRPSFHQTEQTQYNWPRLGLTQLEETKKNMISVEWMFLVLVQEALTVLKPVSRSGFTQKH